MEINNISEEFFTSKKYVGFRIEVESKLVFYIAFLFLGGGKGRKKKIIKRGLRINSHAISVSGKPCHRSEYFLILFFFFFSNKWIKRITWVSDAL